jgi:deoxycytidylate deaminase
MFKVRHNLTAIITDKRDRILSIGKNSYVKTHPLQAHYARKSGVSDKIFLHAEIAAIVKCRDIEKAHKITIIRVNNQGQERPAKPCPICMQAILETGIKIIKHT